MTYFSKGSKTLVGSLMILHLSVIVQVYKEKQPKEH